MRRIVSESFANLRGRRWLALCVALTIAISIWFTVAAELSQLSSAWKSDAELRAQGYTTLRLVATAPDKELTAHDCELLGRIPGVSVAAWIGETVDATLHTGEAIKVLPVGPNFALLVATIDATFAEQGERAGAVIDVSSSIAAGRHRRGDLSVKVNSTFVALSYSSADLNALGPQLAGALATPTAIPTVVASCLATTATGTRDVVRSSVNARWPAVSGYSSGWILDGSDTAAAPDLVFEHRNTRTLWLLATTVISLVWALTLRIRRNDLAFYAIAGLRPRRIFGIYCTEYLTIALTAAACPLALVAAGMAAHRLAGAAGALAATTIVRTFLASTGVSIVITALMTPQADQRLLAALKDR